MLQLRPGPRLLTLVSPTLHLGQGCNGIHSGAKVAVPMKMPLAASQLGLGSFCLPHPFCLELPTASGFWPLSGLGLSSLRLRFQEADSSLPVSLSLCPGLPSGPGGLSWCHLNMEPHPAFVLCNFL